MEANWDILGALLIMGLVVLGLTARRGRVATPSPAPDEESGEGADLKEVELAIEFAALQDRARFLDRENLLLREEIARLRMAGGRETQAALTDDERGMAMMILGLDPDGAVDGDALRHAFRASVKRNHPDARGNPHTLRVIIRAHEYLLAYSSVQRWSK